MSENEILVGPHMFRWEPPDIGYITYAGDLDGYTMSRLSEEGRRFTLGHPYVFLLIDMSNIGKISAEARRSSATGSSEINLRGMAIIGASAPLRIIAGLVARAVDLMNRHADNPTRFFETEAEARAWIASRRVAIQRSRRGAP